MEEKFIYFYSVVIIRVITFASILLSVHLQEVLTLLPIPLSGMKSMPNISLLQVHWR